MRFAQSEHLHQSLSFSAARATCTELRNACRNRHFFLLAKKSKGSTQSIWNICQLIKIYPLGLPQKPSREEGRRFSGLFTTAVCKRALNSAAPPPFLQSTYYVAMSRTITALQLKNSSHYSILHQIFSLKTHMAPEKMFLHRYKTSTFKYARTHAHKVN